MMKKAHAPVLVIAAHPDDEVLGCGGTIGWHTKQGHEVHVLVLGEGATSRGSDPRGRNRVKEVRALDRAVCEAARALGVKEVHRAHFPDNRFDSVALLDVVKAVEQVVTAVRPGRIYTHHAGDLNIDHRIVHQAVLTAARPQPGSSVTTVLAFEVPSSTEWQGAGSDVPFLPQVYVDITSTLSRKLKALKYYESEMKPYPHARSFHSVEIIAKRWGLNVGLEAAEAFMMVRDVIRADTNLASRR